MVLPVLIIYGSEVAHMCASGFAEVSRRKNYHIYFVVRCFDGKNYLVLNLYTYLVYTNSSLYFGKIPLLRVNEALQTSGSGALVIYDNSKVPKRDASKMSHALVTDLRS